MPSESSSLGTGVPTILDRIVEERRAAVAAAAIASPEDTLQHEAKRRVPRDFLAALRRGARRGMPAVIAELKRASPSRGRIRDGFDVAALAADYERAGAAALSVLTEPNHFDGRLEYLGQVRAATRLPVLRKDFIFSSYQIWEAAAAGADAILLIAAMLDEAALVELSRVARAAGLTVLCEVHDAGELARARAAGAECIGVNSRDLHTFQVDTQRALALARQMPEGAICVAESGLRHCADLEAMSAAGYAAVLVGERLMSATDPGVALARLTGGWVKICGLTHPDDAAAAAGAGADAAGVVFARSPRQVSPDEANAVLQALPPGVRRVGVFAAMGVNQIADIAAHCRLDAVQLHGDYSPEQGRALAADVSVWRALAADGDLAAARPWRDCAQRFVLDTAALGGTGRSFDWDAAPAIIAALRPIPVMLAGGLNPDNVAEALRRAGAWAVDVSSGVEAEPRRKSPTKITAFVQAARREFAARKDYGD